jgi:hypothetical protein
MACVIKSGSTNLKSCRKTGICTAEISCHGDFTVCALTSAFCYDQCRRDHEYYDRSRSRHDGTFFIRMVRNYEAFSKMIQEIK